MGGLVDRRRTTWDGGGGTIPGSAAAAYEVDPSSSAQTDVFPTIAAGDPGKVDVGWLRTNEIEPTDALGKFDPAAARFRATGTRAPIRRSAA